MKDLKFEIKVAVDDSPEAHPYKFRASLQMEHPFLENQWIYWGGSGGATLLEALEGAAAAYRIAIEEALDRLRVGDAKIVNDFEFGGFRFWTLKRKGVAMNSGEAFQTLVCAEDAIEILSDPKKTLAISHLCPMVAKAEKAALVLVGLLEAYNAEKK